MSYGYSHRSHAPEGAVWWERATLDPQEVHDTLVMLGQVEEPRWVDGVLEPEVSLEPPSSMSLTWRPCPAPVDVWSPVRTDPLEPAALQARRAARTATERAPRAWRTRQRQLRRLKGLQAQHRAAREAAARARQTEAADAAEYAAWTLEDRARIRAEQRAMQLGRHQEGRITPEADARDRAALENLAKGVSEAPIEGRWASAPIFETRVDRSAPWGHLVMGRRCITAVDTPLCTCGIHRLTWED